MRIISQTCNSNINYEISHLYNEDDVSGKRYFIKAWVGGTDIEFFIGDYATKQQRDEVFEEIITMGSSGMKVYRMPEDEGSGCDADACPIDR